MTLIDFGGFVVAVAKFLQLSLHLYLSLNFFIFKIGNKMQSNFSDCEVHNANCIASPRPQVIINNFAFREEMLTNCDACTIKIKTFKGIIANFKR